MVCTAHRTHSYRHGYNNGVYSTQNTVIDMDTIIVSTAHNTVIDMDPIMMSTAHRTQL